VRYSEEHKRRTRDRVLSETTKAIRADGAERISVAGVMRRAGLTHGAFYAYFPSKDELVAAGIERMFEEVRAGPLREVANAGSKGAILVAYLDYYLSPTHRDSRDSGCPLPFLAADAPRLVGSARERFAAGIATLTAIAAGLLRGLSEAEPELAAMSLLSELVGAVSLARAEIDRDRSDAILMSSLKSLKQRFRLEIPQSMGDE
jgi:TetR/AcrR family transcriptional repressor of nem operon